MITEVRIFDVIGKEVFFVPYPDNKRINISFLLSGYYNLKCKADDKIYHGKFVK